MFVLLLPILAFAATVLGISVTTSTSSYVVDSASSDGFKVTFSRSTCDITSILYRATEYQYASTYSHVASGLGSATVSYQTVGEYSNLMWKSHSKIIIQTIMSSFLA